MLKRLPLILLLALLISACSNETLTPDDDQNGQLSISEISSNNFSDKTTITQGIAGTIFRVTSADASIGGIIVQDAEPEVAFAGIYRMDEIEEPQDSSIDSTWWYYEFPMVYPIFVKVAGTVSDAEGFYQIAIDPGDYILAVDEDELADTLNSFSMWDLANPGLIDEPPYPTDMLRYGGMENLYWFDDILMSGVTIERGSVRKADVFLQEPQDPWFPPEDSLEPWWPPMDTLIWPPDTGWTWPDDSLNTALLDYWELLDFNRTRVTINTGIYGTVTHWSGDFMPMMTTGEIEPMQYPVRVYEATNNDSTDIVWGTYYQFVSQVNTPLVTEVTPDSLGFYEVELPAGEYSAFAVVGEDSLLPIPDYMMGPMPMPFLPGTIHTGDRFELNFEEKSRTTW